MILKFAFSVVILTIFLSWLSICEGASDGVRGWQSAGSSVANFQARAKQAVGTRLSKLGSSIRGKSTQHATKIIDMFFPKNFAPCPIYKCMLLSRPNCVRVKSNEKKENGCPKYPCGRDICGPESHHYYSQPQISEKEEFSKWEDCIGGSKAMCSSLCNQNTNGGSYPVDRKLQEESYKTAKKHQAERVRRSEEDLKASMQKQKAADEKLSEAAAQEKEQNKEFAAAGKVVDSHKNLETGRVSEQDRKVILRAKTKQKQAEENEKSAKQNEIAEKSRVEIIKKEIETEKRIHEAEVEKMNKVEKAEKERKRGLPDPHNSCVEIKVADTCASDSYFGTIAGDFTPEDVKTASATLLNLLPHLSMIGISVSSDCKRQIRNDICETALPPCTETCQPTKTCKKSCKSLQSTCVQFHDQLQLISKTGTYRSFIGMFGFQEGTKSTAILDMWISKITSCDDESVSNTSTCIGDNFETTCNPKAMSAEKVFLETSSRRLSPLPVNDDQCKEIVCDFDGCKHARYYGTMKNGETTLSIKAASEKFKSLVRSYGPVLGLSLSDKCMSMLSGDLVETMMPRCSEKCNSMKTCKKTCTDIQNECLGKGLKEQLEMAMGLGGLVDGFLGESAQVIRTWVKKLTTCEGDSVSSSETECLSESYNSPLCDPDTEEPVTDAPTTDPPTAYGPVVIEGNLFCPRSIRIPQLFRL